MKILLLIAELFNVGGRAKRLTDRQTGRQSVVSQRDRQKDSHDETNNRF